MKQMEKTPAPPYDGHIDCDIAVKGTPVPEEYELYDLTHDPMELSNKYNKPDYSAQQSLLAQLLAEERSRKRLCPISGEVAGQPFCNQQRR